MTDIDKTDRSILRLLLENARMTNVAIGEKVNLSHSAISQRVKALEEKGYISGYRAILDREKIDLGYTACMLVRLVRHGGGRLEAFESLLKDKYPNVVECLRLAGAWDFMLRVVAKGSREYDQVVSTLTRDEHVDLVRTYPSLRTVFTAPLPLS
jgi:Lrp/AsnC family transcriptional regulator, leucine-responsive regulatory protein